MPLTEQAIDDVVARYIRERDRYEKLVAYVSDECRALIRDKNIPATVSGRAKTPQSLRRKLIKLKNDPRFDSVDSVFAKLSDLAGVRVSTYVEYDRERVIGELQLAFLLPKEDIDRKDKTTLPNGQPAYGKHYRAIHCQVRIKSPEDGEEQPAAERAYVENILDTHCEIQVCSMLAHVWNELEHDIGYKPVGDGPSEGVTKVLETLGQLVAAGDHLVQALITENGRAAVALSDDKPFTDEYDFVARVHKWFGDARNFAWYSAQLLDALRELGIDNPRQIERSLLSGDYTQKAKDLIIDLNERQKKEGWRMVELDPTSSDLLSALFLDRHFQTFLERHPTGQGRGRPPRLVSIAKRFQWAREPGSAVP